MLAITLPTARTDGEPEAGTLDWLLAGLQVGQGLFASTLSVGSYAGNAVGITLAETGATPLRLAIQVAGERVADAGVEVAPALIVEASDPGRASAFLRESWRALDHVGVNLASTDITREYWDRLVAQIAAAVPAYRLDVPSANDIVLIVTETPGGGTGVIELVLDMSAKCSSVHICAEVAATRAVVEQAFPAPYGAYKPGDEPYFRSIALRSSLKIPAYLDLAFSDGGMTPWPQIVAAMGQRIDGGAGCPVVLETR